MDQAHKWTEATLKNLEKRIKAEYTKAYQSCKKEMSAIMEKIADHPEWDGARKFAEMQKYDRLDRLSKQMAETINDASNQAVKFIKGEAVNVFKYNYNWEAGEFGFSLIDNTAAKNILTGVSNPFTKLSYENVTDRVSLQRALQSDLTTGLLKGESIRDIALRIKTTTERDLKECVRIARTETTYAQNSARQSVGEEGEKLGFKMLKKWVAAIDGRTRDEHERADGQIVPADDPFIVGGEELMFPGDYSLGASAWNTVNCRCTVVYMIDKGN